MGEGLAPGMQYGEKADSGAEMLWVGGDAKQSLRGCFKQQIVDDGLVLKGHRPQLAWQSECNVKVLDGQQLGTASFEPLCFGQRLSLGTVTIPTGVVGDPLIIAIVAFFNMAAESLGAANLYGSHSSVLFAR